jgi:hypothetical protein
MKTASLGTVKFSNFEQVDLPYVGREYKTFIWTFDFNTTVDVEFTDDMFAKSDQSEFFNLPANRQFYVNGSSIELDQMIKDNNSLLSIILPNVLKSQDKIFHDRWVTNAEDIKKCSNFYTRIVKDDHGLDMGPHLDNSFVIGNIILNLIDNKVGTKFYSHGTDKTFIAPKEKNKGIFFLNTPGSLHSIKNDSNQTRYTLNTYWNLNVQII